VSNLELMRTENEPFFRNLPIRPCLVGALVETGDNAFNDGFVDTDPNEYHFSIGILLEQLLEGEQSGAFIHHLRFRS